MCRLILLGLPLLRCSSEKNESWAVCEVVCEFTVGGHVGCGLVDDWVGVKWPRFLWCFVDTTEACWIIVAFDNTFALVECPCAQTFRAKKMRLRSDALCKI
jgi:hypothetical protein